MAIPFSSQRYCKSGSAFLRRLDLPQCFLHSGIDGSLLAACRRIKTQIWNKTLKSLKSLTILN